MRYIRESEVPAIEKSIFAAELAMGPGDPATIAHRHNITSEDVDRIRRWALKRDLGSLEQPTELGDGGGSDDGTRFE